ncbi:YdeI/OmpD-associated family protein [Mesorhizobium sp. A623]
MSAFETCLPKFAVPLPANNCRFILNCGHFIVQLPKSEAAVLFGVGERGLLAGFFGSCMTNAFPHGTVHEAGEDLQAALRSDPNIFVPWENLTPLGRNEFICWVEDAKQLKTRQRRIERTCEELLEGKKRPCCWVGCIHRTDKAPSRWQQAVLIDQQGKSRQ